MNNLQFTHANSAVNEPMVGTVPISILNNGVMVTIDYVQNPHVKLRPKSYPDH